LNLDQGVIYVLMEHFTRHLHPRAVEIEKELDTGRRLSDAQIDHVSQVLEEVKLLQPLIARHPEHRELADGVIALYASIARRAWQNETSPNSGATTATTLRQ
jgi:hypothetical protein